MNELIFAGYTLTISAFAIITLRYAQEALIAYIALLTVLINLFVTKEITLFGLSATASDAFAVGITLSLNLLQEYFGKAKAQRAIWISFMCSFMYTVFSLFHIAYKAGPHDVVSHCFDILLYPMPRIVMASLVVFLVVQNLDCQLYSYMRKRFSNAFLIRNYSSIAITQLLDTILFSFLGLYGINPAYSNLRTIFQIIIISYTIKVAAIILTAPIVALTKRIIKIKPS